MLFLHFRHERFFRGRTPALEKINLNGQHILAGCGESLRMRTLTIMPVMPVLFFAAAALRLVLLNIIERGVVDLSCPASLSAVS
jgi:hypothetical protein